MPSSAILPCMPTEFIQKHDARNAGFAGRPSNKAPGAAMECYGCGAQRFELQHCALRMYAPRPIISEQLWAIRLSVADQRCRKNRHWLLKKKRTLIPYPVSKGWPVWKFPLGSQTPRLLRRPSRPWNHGFYRFLPAKMMVFVQIKCNFVNPSLGLFVGLLSMVLCP